MGVIPGCLGGLTPICDRCGIKLCWEIVPETEYEPNKKFWDNWECENCNPDYKFKLREIKDGMEKDGMEKVLVSISSDMGAV